MTSSNTPDRNAAAACAACLEPIRDGAVTCPHCGSSQVPHRWHNVSQALKWIGGIVTTISLVVGVITLSQYYIDWREQRADIAEIVAAADWLIKSESYPQAWQMYARAAAINPSSQLVRDGRFRLSLQWLRNFDADPAKLEQTLGEIGETLYRGLANADARQSATILAHAGYVQELRHVNRLPVFTDVESLYRQALAADPGNVYANAMYGRWLLWHKPMTSARLRQAAARFEQALASGDEREFVRRLQFLALANFTYGHGDELERTALTLLLQAGSDMLARGEDPPPRNARILIVDGYGRLGKAEHVEALLAALPPAAHLRVYEWLLAVDDDTRSGMRQQSTYVRARLHEAAGNAERALELYRELLASDTRAELATLVDRGLERLTGELPPRALARNYRDDAPPDSNPSGFHFDTLRHFDPSIRGENLQQALAYFERPAGIEPQRLTELQAALPALVERVREALHEADQIERLNAYSTGFSRWHHDNVRDSWVSLMRLHARVLEAGGQHEAALARLLDASRKINGLDQTWQPRQALLEYEIAGLYARLAARSGSDSDREQAMLKLQSAVGRGLVESKQASWGDIKSDAFAVLRGDPRYQDLVRGR